MRREEENKKRKNKGFTLVELIIVIAILAVIAAVAAPNLIGNIGRARRTADVANAKVIGDAVVLTMVQDSKYSAIPLTKFELKNDTPSADELAFVNAIKANLQTIPVPKNADNFAFKVTVTTAGVVEVYTGTAGTDTSDIKLYPEVETGSIYED